MIGLLRRLATALAVGCALTGAASAQTAPRLLDGFEDLAPWEALASDGVDSSITQAAGIEGRAMRLDFDFNDVSGYAFARRTAPIVFPENYEISFWLRADAPVNTLEVKFVDASGDNVWWRQRVNLEFPKTWTLVRIKKRQIDFAWGPTTDKTLRRTERVEFVVVRGKGGGAGSIYIDQLSIRELPAEPAVPPAPLASADAWLPGAPPGLAVDGDRATAWRASAGRRSLTLDLGYARELGGLDLRWAEGAHASRYSVSTSEDGRDWGEVRRVEGGDGGRDPLRLPEAEARYVRFDLQEGPGASYALAEVEVEPLAFGATPTAFVEAIAEDSRRGLYPRGFQEQSYWTLVGVDGGRESGLLGEDGALEWRRGGPSTEPFVLADGKLWTWADVRVSQSLLEGYLPIPSVTWEAPKWRMKVTAFADGDAADSRLMGRYDLVNTSDAPQTLTLALATRPLQVNGPRQFLATPGGVSPITTLRLDGEILRINDALEVAPVVQGGEFRASAFDAGSDPGSLLAQGRRTAPTVNDPTGLAAAAWLYTVTLRPGETRTFAVVAPLTGAQSDTLSRPDDPLTWLDARQAVVARQWRRRLDRVTFTVPEAGRTMVDTLRSSLAHILMSRDGPILKPGTRSYDRSWIRDGAMIAESLVRLGSAEIAADYLRWYAPFQFDSGKVPCCVDSRGADPTPENDSHGELIFLAAEVWRHTRDEALLRSVWPRLLAAARYMDGLRASEQTAANRTPERRHLYGLLPPSISHEGYSSKPAYSHWDNFWGLLGYKDAVVLAEVLGEREAAAALARSRDEFRRDLYASIAAMPAVHGIDFIPGAADLGDFDATSTTIALAPGGEMARLPPEQLRATFERYWREFVERRDGRKSWDAYTPYELRSVGAFVRLGWRERAHALLDFFFDDRRPRAWNGWAEVVGRDAREPRFIGDMPHAWISSDYIRSALDMFAYERDTDGALVLADGIPAAWLDGRGVGVEGLRTPHGTLGYTLRNIGPNLMLTITGDARPPGGFVLRSSWTGTPPVASRNGRPLRWRDGELRIPAAGRVIIPRPMGRPAETFQPVGTSGSRSPGARTAAPAGS